MVAAAAVIKQVTDLQKAVLTIAGSDPSGGAGIQADLKTLTAIGVYGGAAISAITSQNSLGVKGIYPLSPEQIRAQIEPVLADLNISHIKIGMVGSSTVARTIAQVLKNFSGEIIYDPVLKASSGHSLFKANKEANSLTELLEVITVLTPNLPELAIISGQQCNELENALKAAQKLMKVYPNIRAICLKGGHIREEDNTVNDFLLTSQGDLVRAEHPRFKTSNLHGTGCTFAAAFAAFHLLLADDNQAFSKASKFTAKLIDKSQNLNIAHGNGPLGHHLG